MYISLVKMKHINSETRVLVDNNCVIVSHKCRTVWRRWGGGTKLYITQRIRDGLTRKTLGRWAAMKA